LSLCHQFSSHQLHLLFSAPACRHLSCCTKDLLTRAKYPSLFHLFLENVDSVFSLLISLIILHNHFYSILEDDAEPGADVSSTAAQTTRSMRRLVEKTCRLSPPAGKGQWDSYSHPFLCKRSNNTLSLNLTSKSTQSNTSADNTELQ